MPDMQVALIGMRGDTWIIMVHVSSVFLQRLHFVDCAGGRVSLPTYES